MRNGYDQFFKSARKAKLGDSPKQAPLFPTSAPKKGPRFEITAGQLEEHLRRRAGVRKAKRRKKFPWGLTLTSVVGVAVTAWAMFNADQVEGYVKRVEVSWLGTASASEGAPSSPSAAASEGAAGAAAAPAEAAAEKPHEVSAGDIDHLSKLIERKKELDAREQEIARQEAELARMKVDLEKRMEELADMRAKISEMLADRVKADESKLETLVQMYSNMKPPQAAKIFESMDEDLAVEILGRMKKKSAADIMNLLKPEKAQVFSEKYAGYKRLPASK